MRTREKRFSLALFAILVIGFSFWFYHLSKVQVNPIIGFNHHISNSKDSVMLMGRHMGYINFNRFDKIAKENISTDTSIINILVIDDSAYITTKYPHYFFGQNTNWLSSYKNLPIHIMPNGFCAKLRTIDSIQYIFLPYQILANIALKGRSSISMDDGANNDPRPTIRDFNSLPRPESIRGNKIQTEGIVRQNVLEILADTPNLNQEEQLEILWRYAKNNWNYLNDPYSTTDTWRSASETINDYYFINGKCYTGDCDDFAILMASFARQVGFPSRFVAAYNDTDTEGHAYAEYYNGKKWIPLDWFSDKFGGQPFEASRKQYYNDL